MAQIITLTINPSIDKSTRVKNVVPEQKLRCATPKWQAGGGGINVTRVIKRLGGTSLAIYTAGGPQGRLLTNILDSEGIDQQVVPINCFTRESFSVRETASNQQYRFSVPGPDLTEEEWTSCLQAIRNLDPKPNYLVLSGGLAPGVPEEFYGRIAKETRDDDIRIILDTHHAPLRQAIKAGIFLFKPNLRELRQLTGLKLENEEKQEKILQKIIGQGGAKYIVLSLGAAGAVFASSNGICRLRAPTVKIRSKVGAGDSMVGGIVWALDQGYTPQEAARFGVAAGAAAVQTPGTELCRRADVFDLYKQIHKEETHE